VTLTYRDLPPSPTSWTKPGWSYAKRSWDRFCERVRPAVGELVWVRCFEMQRERGVPHIHALVAGLDSLSYSPVARWYWATYGYSRILEYDSRLGAGYYLSKYLAKDLSDIAFSPSLRGGGTDVLVPRGHP